MLKEITALTTQNIVVLIVDLRKKRRRQSIRI